MGVCGRDLARYDIPIRLPDRSPVNPTPLLRTRPTRMQAVQSPIIPIVADLIRQTPGTISLGQGIAYYGPPQQALDQIPLCLSDPSNHQYKAVHGLPQLIEILEHKLQTENQIPIQPDQNRVVVTAGCNMAFMNAILAITAPGDEIILLTPYYFNHDMAITMADCRMIPVATDANYQPDLKAITQAITERTRALVTISPNNPTGAVYHRDVLQQVNDLCRERGIYHIHDETYEYFTYDGIDHSSPASFPGSASHTISLFSLSKAYGFAGWRIGYMVIPADLFEPVLKIQDTILICPPVIAQFAAVGALQVGRGYCLEKLAAIEAVRQIALQEFEQISDLCTIPAAQGAFYFLIRVHRPLDSMDLVERLIREHQVAVIPGSTFGLDQGGYLRVAYGALQQETAAAGIGRLVTGLQQILD